MDIVKWQGDVPANPLLADQLENITAEQVWYLLGAPDGALGYGYSSSIYVTNLKTQKLLGSKYLVDLVQELNIPGLNLAICTSSRGPITVLREEGNKAYCSVTIQNPKNYGYLIFTVEDTDNNPIKAVAYEQLYQYDLLNNELFYPSASEFYLKSKMAWWLKAQDPKGSVALNYVTNDMLTGMSFTNEVTGEVVNLNRGDNKTPMLSVVGHSALAQYCVFDQSAAFKKMGAHNPQVEGGTWYDHSGGLRLWGLDVNNKLHPLKNIFSLSQAILKG